MPALDAIDRKILSLLQSDSRMTMQELSDKVGLSVSPCHRRVKLLEERGVIVSPREGAVRFSPHAGNDLDELERAFAAIDAADA